MRVRVRQSDKMFAFMLAEAIVNAEPGTIISVDNEFMAEQAQLKMDQIHRSDLEIQIEEKD